jgi:hypothetical protein
MVLTRSSILSADDAVSSMELIEIPEWGGAAFVRVMTGAQRDRLEAFHAKDPGNNFRARVVAATLCDASGNLLFGEADVPALGAKSAAVLDRCSEVAIRVNKIGKRDIAELEKNS